MADDKLRQATSAVIRLERETDLPSIRDLTTAAFAGSEFGHHGEADLIEQIRKACPESLSLVAELDGRIAGHILFSPAQIVGESASVMGMALAPMSVLPEFQRQGIGTRLVRTGLDLLAERGIGWVAVLGHPSFCQRFGFEPAGRYGISCEFPGIPDDVFRVTWLSGDDTELPQGVVKYRPEFSEMLD